MKTKFHYLLLIPFLLAGCKKDSRQQTLTATGPAITKAKTLSVTGIPSFFAMGADVGYLSQMEAAGQLFYNKSGAPEDCLQILKDEGINSIRLRAWVNPTNGFCGTNDIVKMAVRAKAKGFHVLIDFQYSDTWADINNQHMPAAWASDTFPQLLTDVYNYTYHVMDTLKTNGVTPDWVQVGNEIIHGMLLPSGSTSNYANLAQLINQGYAAVKAVSPTTQVIIHATGAENGSALQSFYDNLASNSANYDIVGLTYYPYYSSETYYQMDPTLSATMSNMVSRYGKRVMVVETGNDYTQPQSTFDGLNDCINRVSTVSGANGMGVFYWEPEAYYSWSGYQLNAFDNTTKEPTHAMDAFLYNPANNLINNADFENGGVQNSTITGWSTWSNGNYNAIYTESGGYTRSYRLTNWKSTAYEASTYQNFTGIANGTYMLTAWVQNGGGQTTCQLYAKNFGNAEMDYSLPVTTGWTQITINNIHVTNNTIEVGLWSVANAGNWCSIDNVHLQLQ
jgi:arabinogalactan endo-1,4-beta-galactosidase